MRTKLLWIGMALATGITCRLGVWLFDLNAYCVTGTNTWDCHEHTFLLDMASMALPF